MSFDIISYYERSIGMDYSQKTAKLTDDRLTFMAQKGKRKVSLIVSLKPGFPDFKRIYIAPQNYSVK